MAEAEADAREENGGAEDDVERREVAEEVEDDSVLETDARHPESRYTIKEIYILIHKIKSMYPV